MGGAGSVRITAAMVGQTVEYAAGKSVPALGPHPSRGDYKQCFTIQGLRGEFVQQTPAIVGRVAQAIECSRQMPTGKKREAIAGMKAWAYDVLDDGAPALQCPRDRDIMAPTSLQT